MSFSDTLNDIYRSLASSSADIDEKIARLQRAKSEIVQEQNISQQEIRRILEPELGTLWTGNRARAFDDSREEAHRTMQGIVNEDYSDYQQSIDMKITLLRAERSALDGLSHMANEASELLNKGEEAFEELGNKLDDLKRRLF
ncbi:DUF5082 family protein [Fictibacillus sp. b24]|uniref:YwqH-like family protein n=1 Tax=Fictibacillus sp. b24 TaxID=3055863 RepID=UPI0025A08F75|nr:DUF5082 family protein [Fictibacillus sp. b24]MDM5318077.1 DUF5082 family protein [Fictibacillus sp. b24]